MSQRMASPKSFSPKKGRAPLPPTSREVEQNKQNEAKDAIRKSRNRGAALIEQGLACEESAVAGAGSSSSVNTSRNNPMAASLYKLGIGQLSDALAKLNLQTQKEPAEQQLEKDLIRLMSDAQDRLDVLKHSESSTQTSLTPSSNSSSSSAESSPTPPTAPREDSELNSETDSYSSSYLRPTLSSSLKSRTQSPAKVKEHSSGRSRGTPTKANGANNTPSTSTTRKIKKPEMFMSELEKFLSHCIVKKSDQTNFNDVIGQEKAKGALNEMVVLPAERPDLFRGLRCPGRGLLLFGPPGNGKTMLVRGLAGELGDTTLFSVTASSLTSKFMGEGEKLVRTLFDMARKRAPAIIFIDEVDSILCSRKDSDHEASRRLKTEFFASFDGLQSSGSGINERVLVIGATNRPQELDDAALRRFTKRIYIPMPDQMARQLLLIKLLSVHGDPLSAEEIFEVGRLTAGYSNSDLTNLAREAALGPLRDCSSGPRSIRSVQVKDLRPINLSDFRKAISQVRTSVSTDLMRTYEQWNKRYGDVSTV